MKEQQQCSYCNLAFNRHNGICKTCGKDWNKKKPILIHPCQCIDYNRDQCYNCLNGAHDICEARGKKRCKKRQAKQVGLRLVFKESK
jgi:hypothetical protein